MPSSRQCATLRLRLGFERKNCGLPQINEAIGAVEFRFFFFSSSHAIQSVVVTLEIISTELSKPANALAAHRKIQNALGSRGAMLFHRCRCKQNQVGHVSR